MVKFTINHFTISFRWLIPGLVGAAQEPGLGLAVGSLPNFLRPSSASTALLITAGYPDRAERTFAMASSTRFLYQRHFFAEVWSVFSEE